MGISDNFFSAIVPYLSRVRVRTALEAKLRASKAEMEKQLYGRSDGPSADDHFLYQFSRTLPNRCLVCEHVLPPRALAAAPLAGGWRRASCSLV